MIEADKLEAMAENLRLYDVVDGGWVHEGRGLDFNLKHVGLHLSDVIDRKDFTDSRQIQNEIAPDCVQYALRLARWGGFAVSLVGALEEHEAEQDEVIGRADVLGLDYLSDYVAVIRANGILARERHAVDHMENPDPQEQNTQELISAAGMLFYAAEVQSHDFGFDLVEAFDTRLASLRERHDVPRRTDIEP